MAEQRSIYLDHAASSPVAPGVIEAMTPYLSGHFANPSSTHRAARSVRRAIDDAREELASLLGCRADEIVYTSGGTEADNLAIAGLQRPPDSRIVVSAIEHHAVLRAAETVGAVTLGVDATGRVDLAAAADLLDDRVALCSVMLVNNETGVVEPLSAIAELVREHAPDAVLHSDVVQAYGWYDVARLGVVADVLSVSAHKFGGPKGIGALVLRQSVRPRYGPIIHGGAQERELRAGTENVAGVIAMTTAARLAEQGRVDAVARATEFRASLLAGARHACPDVIETVPAAQSSPAILHLRFPGIIAEELLFVLDDLGVAASAGAACAAGAIEASHVLLAMGLSEAEAKSAVRFSFGSSTTQDDVTGAIEALGLAIERLGRGSVSKRRN